MGSGSDKAQRAAEGAERERQQAMERGTSRVNAVFDSPQRAAQLDDFIRALRDRYLIDANRQKGTADRRLRFSMARSGLTGGSASVDANRLLGEEYTKGLLDSESRAQEAQGRLKGQDESSRLQLINMIRSGMDATTAAQRAGALMSANAQTAEGEALAGGLGDIFGGTASIYKGQQEAAERRRGERAAYDSLPYGGRSAFGGA
jgi:hypothetical protein